MLGSSALLHIHHAASHGFWGLTCRLTQRIEKKLDGNCTRMLRAKLNTSWKLSCTKQQLYGNLPPNSKTIQIRRTRQEVKTNSYATFSYGPLHTDVEVLDDQRELIYNNSDTGCSLENLPKEIDDKDEGWERVREICARSTTWWWWWWLPEVMSDIIFIRFQFYLY